MKAALVTHRLSSAGGGVATAVEALSAALVRGGVETRVFGLGDTLWLTEQTGWRGAPAEAFQTVGPPALGYAPGLGRALRDFAPDVVHTHGIWMFTSATVAQWRATSGMPYVISPHGMLDSWAIRTSRLKKRVARWLFEDRHLANAACLHALNLAEKEALRSYGLFGSVATIPNGFSLPISSASVAPPWEDRFSHGAKILLFLGRLHPKKNVVGLLRAVAILLEQGRLGEWSVAIAGWGEGGHDAELQALSHELGLGNRVAFAGPLHGPNKDAALRHASAFVLPSHSEGLPMAILEAWAYGLPVLITPQCNLPEGFQAQAALRIEVEPERIAQGLAALFAMTNEERTAMGQRGRMLVQEKFNWSNIAEQMLAVYRWVLGQGSKPEYVHLD